MPARDMMTLLEQQAADQLAKHAVDLLAGVVMMTPVDTGRARGNWTVESSGSSSTPGIDSSGGQTIAAGAGVIDRATAKGIPPTITLANNLPYIEPLENGSSRQAPQGMVAVTMARLGLR